MKIIASYSNYEEANDHQITLLSAGIDALVEYQPTGTANIVHGGSGVYVLQVDEARAAEAAELVSVPEDPDAKSIAACPKCGGSNIAESQIPPLLDLGLLMIPSVVRFLTCLLKGVPYVCTDCDHRYRKKL